jgi:hypothetical protein
MAVFWGRAPFITSGTSRMRGSDGRKASGMARRSLRRCPSQSDHLSRPSDRHARSMHSCMPSPASRPTPKILLRPPRVPGQIIAPGSEATPNLLTPGAISRYLSSQTSHKSGVFEEGGGESLWRARTWHVHGLAAGPALQPASWVSTGMNLGSGWLVFAHQARRSKCLLAFSPSPP